MRTTITVADDVQAEIDRLRRDQGLGTSEAFNLLARRGMAAPAPSARIDYVHTSFPMECRVDVSNIAETLDLLDGDRDGL